MIPLNNVNEALGVTEALGAPADAWLEVLGRAHVLSVHFPVALIVVAGLFELLRAVRRREERSVVARACLGLGALAAAIAAGLGWLHAELEPMGSSVERTLFLHRWGGVSTAALLVLIGVLSWRVRADELRTLGEIGCARFTAAWLFGLELGIIVAAATVLAAGAVVSLLALVQRASTII